MTNPLIFVVAGEADFPITEDSLQKFVLSESLMTDLSALVMILVELEGVSESLENVGVLWRFLVIDYIEDPSDPGKEDLSDAPPTLCMK